MTEQHPITPPPELMQQWREQAPRFRDGGIAREEWMMTRSAQWGSNEELYALLVWLRAKGFNDLASDLLDARRPKPPPTLKEQALARLEKMEQLIADLERAGLVPFHERDDSIRLALEQLNG